MELIEGQFLNCVASQIDVDIDSTNIRSAIESGLTPEEYIKIKFQQIMSSWKEKHKEENIPSFMVTLKVGDNFYNVPVGSSEISEKSIFDIASMTKLYTEILLFRVIQSDEKYKCLLDKKLGEFPEFVQKYQSNFGNDLKTSIKDITIRDILKFGIELHSEDLRPNSKAFNSEKPPIDILRSTGELDKRGYYKYSDMGIMILTDFLEYLTNKSYKELMEEFILKPKKLNETYLEIPEDKKDRYIANELNIKNNAVNDPKAVAMGGYYGHAGIKTTSIDYVKFLDAIMEEGFILSGKDDPLLFELFGISDTRYETAFLDGSKASYQVKPGDTIESISKDFNIPISDILKVNKNLNSNELKVRSWITLPFYYTMKENETIERVSQKYDLPLDVLLSLNQGNSSNRIILPITTPEARKKFHLRVFGIGAIGNFNIGTPSFKYGTKTAGTLASNTISSKGFSVQGSTRVHGEVSSYKLWQEESNDESFTFNESINTAFTILTDVYTKSQNIDGTYTFDGKEYYSFDPRGILPYEYYKQLINAVADARTIALFNKYMDLALKHSEGMKR